MQTESFRRGDLVEVRTPAEILATLDERGMLDGLPFMPEMLQFCGRRFTVTKRAEKICDTIHYYTSRRLPRTVILEDLRCDGSGHDGCQAECVLFWKEEWLRRVRPDDELPNRHEDAPRLALAERAANGTRRQVAADSSVDSTEQSARDRDADPHQTVNAADVEISAAPTYVCQATELYRASEYLRTSDLRPYVREYANGNVGLWHFLQVLARAVVQEPLRRLGITANTAVDRGTSQRAQPQPALNLNVGERVRVKSKGRIAATLNVENKNRGLYFDADEMLPFCAGTYRVRQRVNKFIDDRNGEMIHLKTDAITLDGVVCSGERSTSRWFCPRVIYPYWREAWLERVDDGAPRQPRD